MHKGCFILVYMSQSVPDAPHYSTLFLVLVLPLLLIIVSLTKTKVLIFINSHYAKYLLCMARTLYLEPTCVGEVYCIQTLLSSDSEVQTLLPFW